MTVHPTPDLDKVWGKVISEEPICVPQLISARFHGVRLSMLKFVFFSGSGTSLLCPPQWGSPHIPLGTAPRRPKWQIYKMLVLIGTTPVFSCLGPDGAVAFAPHPLKATRSQILGGIKELCKPYLILMLNSS